MIVVRLLEEFIRTGEAPGWATGTDLRGSLGHSVRRLIAATKTGAAGLDWAVLLRQTLRHLPNHARVAAPDLSSGVVDTLRKVGVSRELDGTLSARPYRPGWVADLGDWALDRPIGEAMEWDHAVPGEPWLRRLTGNSAWKSAAQHDATWCALNASPNSTVLVGLPTGSGKSLVYQCCAGVETGLTVLVVPTVALGIDQLAAVKELPLAAKLQPMLYTPGPEAPKVLDALKSRTCRLLISSPEAVVAGHLTEVLRRHAEEGFLCRLVIDEAHLIESWGADFRIEFQLLGATLRQWRAVAPSGIRTLLLSATFSPSTPTMLKELFAVSEGKWEQHIVQRLRPEIHYFAARKWATAAEQFQQVSEAIRHLPRPAILYVTKVSEANEWGESLRNEGFERIRVFHGDTGRAERDEIMAAWRADEIDLVVATSAFGMGVDKSDVRAVVHACLPEGIDRFYQEVGRGGRDGQPCVSLLIPKWGDEQVARALGPTLLTDPGKVNGRWQEIWHSRTAVFDDAGHQTGQFGIRTDVTPQYLFGAESYSENVRWNKRLLLLMDRAGLIKIESLRRQRQTETGELTEIAVIRPLRSTLLFDTSLSDLLDEPRRIELDRTRRATDRLVSYFGRITPVCQELRRHYGSDTLRACGSCGFCRVQENRAVRGRGLTLEQVDNRSTPSVQVVQGPSLATKNGRADVVLALRQLLNTQGPIRIVVDPQHSHELTEIIEMADAGQAQLYRVDALDQRNVASVQLNEAVVVIHVGEVDEKAGVFNRCGRWVTHWLLGGTIEPMAGRWAFMHDDHSRAYPGVDALNRWLGDIGRLGKST